MNYAEYCKKKQEEYNALPVFYAFSIKQFEEAMQERGLNSKHDLDQVRSLGYGGYYLKKDELKIKEFLNKPDELKELMESDEQFAEEAIYFEMANHEYHINWQGDWDVCMCFGGCEYGEMKDYNDYLKEMGYSDKVANIYKKARNRFMKDADKKGWY